MAESFAPPRLIVTTTLPRDPRLYARRHGEILNETLREAAAEHHRRHVPRHFQAFAAAKYGYARRSRKYQALKDRLGLPPLVSPFSRRQGRLPTLVTVMTQFTITATQKRARLKMRLPFRGGTGRLMDDAARARLGKGPLTFQAANAQKILLRTISEIEVIAPDEQRYLNAWIHDRYAEWANAPGEKHRVRN